MLEAPCVLGCEVGGEIESVGDESIRTSPETG
jgi:hypothetical protein